MMSYEEYLQALRIILKKHFSIDNLKSVALAKYGIKYKVDDVNGHTISNLLEYFGRSSDGDFNLDKGIFLIGGIGTGKTLFMSLINELSQDLFEVMKNDIFIRKIFATTYDEEYGQQKQQLDFLELKLQYSNSKEVEVEKEINEIKQEIQPYLLLLKIRKIINELFIKPDDTKIFINHFGIIEARYVIRLFEDYRYEMFKSHSRYTFENGFYLTGTNLCIDDLGLEKQFAMHWGQPIDVMSELILDRYNNQREFKTHFITNLDIDRIKERYGDRITSRLREMVNVVHLNGDDRRK